LDGASGPTFLGRRKDAAIQAGSKGLGGRGGPGYISFLNGEKLRGKKSSFILLIQFPAGRSG